MVCGGFAAPLREGFADKVVIVTSEELMALYAANNIARAIRNYSENGVALCGLVANLRDLDADRASVSRFAGADRDRCPLLLPREAAVREAEYKRVTLVEHAPESELTRKIEALAGSLLSFDRRDGERAQPLTDERFNELSRQAFVVSSPVRRGSSSSSQGCAGCPLRRSSTPSRRSGPIWRRTWLGSPSFGRGTRA